MNQDTIYADLRLAAQRVITSLNDQLRVREAESTGIEALLHAVDESADTASSLARLVLDLLDAGGLILIPETLDEKSIFSLHMDWLSAELDDGTRLELVTGAGLGSSLLGATIRRDGTWIAQTVDTRGMAARWFTHLEDLADKKETQP